MQDESKTPKVGDILKRGEGQWLEVVRVLLLHEFAGRLGVVCEQAIGGRSTQLTVHSHIEFLSESWGGWTPATEAEWSAALESAIKAERDRDASDRRIADEHRYGLRVPVTAGAWERVAKIVTCTASQFHGDDKSKWSRRTGKRINGPGHLHTESAEWSDLVAFVGERKRVDIVAERKRAAEKDKT